jgi:hypothetical protein
MPEMLSKTFWRSIFYGRRCVWFVTHTFGRITADVTVDEDALAA